MSTIKRTADWPLARFRASSAGVRGGRDRLRRYRLIERLSNINAVRRRLGHHGLSRAAYS